jgi:hypothetical protein
MWEAEIVETAIVWTTCGVLAMLFILVKLGGGPVILGGQDVIPQRQMAAAEVDLATVDEQLPNRSESHVAANKSDTPE